MVCSRLCVRVCVCVCVCVCVWSETSVLSSPNSGRAISTKVVLENIPRDLTVTNVFVSKHKFCFVADKVITITIIIISSIIILLLLLLLLVLLLLLLLLVLLLRLNSKVLL